MKDFTCCVIGGIMGFVLMIFYILCTSDVKEEKESIIIPKVEVIYIEKAPEVNKIASNPTPYIMTEEDIAEEIKYGEMELIAQLVQAEAGNQDLMGKQLVADVVLNRVDDPRFPNTVEEVIFQKDPVQFTVTISGAFDKAGWYIDEETYQAVLMEYENRTNNGILYFATTPSNGKNHFQHGDHWFGY